MNQDMLHQLEYINKGNLNIGNGEKVNRPILIILVGYLVGILWGLYVKSIALFFIFIILLFSLYYIFPLPFKLKKYRKYFKLIIKKKVVLLLIISMMLSYTNVKFKNKRYDTLYTNRARDRNNCYCDE